MSKPCLKLQIPSLLTFRKKVQIIIAFQAPFLGVVLQILDLMSRIFLFFRIHPNPLFFIQLLLRHWTEWTFMVLDTKHSFLNPYFAHL